MPSRIVLNLIAALRHCLTCLCLNDGLDYKYDIIDCHRKRDDRRSLWIDDRCENQSKSLNYQLTP